MKNINYIILLVTFILFSCSGDSKIEKKLFAKIENGMTVNEVNKILGTPTDSTFSNVDSIGFCYYYFTDNKSGLRPSLPIVCFNKEKKVVFADYGDQ